MIFMPRQETRAETLKSFLCKIKLEAKTAIRLSLKAWLAPPGGGAGHKTKVPGKGIPTRRKPQKDLEEAIFGPSSQ